MGIRRKEALVSACCGPHKSGAVGASFFENLGKNMFTFLNKKKTKLDL